MKELSQLRMCANKAERTSYKVRNLPEHQAHNEHKEAKSKYQKTLQSTKQQHWREWLKKAEDPDIWSANQLIAAPPTDRGKAKILKLKHKVGGEDTTASTNKEKSAALARNFFLAKPQEEPQMHNIPPKVCKGVGKIMKEQIQVQLKTIKPYKALGPDGIPNVVLSNCTDEITDRLFYIYKAMLEGGLMYKPWKASTTVMLRKPGKPCYDIPKAYRPIALLNTMWKVLSAIITNHISFLTEEHQLLPTNHFRGRPGRTTADALYLLTYKIKETWWAGKIVAVLFLDIEGAFPNAVPVRLLHNLQKQGVPSKYVNFISSML